MSSQPNHTGKVSCLRSARVANSEFSIFLNLRKLKSDITSSQITKITSASPVMPSRLPSALEIEPKLRKYRTRDYTYEQMKDALLMDGISMS
jgi:hypothetical protein